jgi:hypothetical protein
VFLKYYYITVLVAVVFSASSFAKFLDISSVQQSNNCKTISRSRSFSTCHSRDAFQEFNQFSNLLRSIHPRVLITGHILGQMFSLKPKHMPKLINCAIQVSV